jgi:putative ABC transport system substrate-binding protein
MADAVRGGADVIVTSGTPSSLAAKEATKTIPVVLYNINDPVAVGLAASMARPGGNITGFTGNVEGGGVRAKRVEMLKEIMPALSRIGLLNRPVNTGAAITVKAMGEVASALGVTATVFEANRVEDFEPVFAAMAQASVQAVVIDDDGTFTANRVPIMAQAMRRKLPVVCGFREIVEAGCLFSYSADIRDNLRRTAGYVDRILKGAKPAELPFQQPVKFELVINMKIAKALGIEIPLLILAQADEVIE